MSVKRSKSAQPEIVDVGQLANYPFILLNSHAVTHIVVDVDQANKIEPGHQPGFEPYHYGDLGLPRPNCVTLSDAPSGRYQAVWLLAHPVGRKTTDGRKIDYVRRVREAMTLAMGGDLACNMHGAVRNPFFAGHRVAWWHHGTHTLPRLDIGVAAPRETSLQRHCAGYTQGRRNCATFRFLLRLFADSRQSLGYNDLMAAACAYQVVAGGPCLAEAENRRICGSICRNGPRYIRQWQRIHGPQLTDDPEVQALLHRMRSAGGKARAAAARDTMREHLAATIDRMSGRITAAAVARAAGVTRPTVHKYMAISNGRFRWKK